MYIKSMIMSCFLTKAPEAPDLSNVDPFDKLQNIGVSNNDTLRGTATSAYNLFLVIGIIGLAVSGTYCGFKIAGHHKAEERSKAKSELGFKFWLALGFFAFVFLIGVVLQIAKSLT